MEIRYFLLLSITMINLSTTTHAVESSLYITGLERGLGMLASQKIITPPAPTISNSDDLKKFMQLQTAYRDAIARRLPIRTYDEEPVPLPESEEKQFEEDKALANAILQHVTSDKVWNGERYRVVDLTKIEQLPGPLNLEPGSVLKNSIDFTNKVFNTRRAPRYPFEFQDTIYKDYSDLYVDFYSKLTFFDTAAIETSRKFIKNILLESLNMILSPDDDGMRLKLGNDYQENSPAGKLLSFFKNIEAILPVDLFKPFSKHFGIILDDEDIKQLTKEILASQPNTRATRALKESLLKEKYFGIYGLFGSFLRATAL